MHRGFPQPIQHLIKPRRVRVLLQGTCEPRWGNRERRKPLEPMLHPGAPMAAERVGDGLSSQGTKKAKQAMRCAKSDKGELERLIRARGLG